MKTSVTIIAILLTSLAQAFEKVDLKIQSNSGDTSLSREILASGDALSFKIHPDGLAFNYLNSTYGATMFLKKEDGHGCATRVSAYGNNEDYEVFFVAEDRSEQGIIAACKSANVSVNLPSRMVVTAIDKKTGQSSSTVLISK